MTSRPGTEQDYGECAITFQDVELHTIRLTNVNKSVYMLNLIKIRAIHDNFIPYFPSKPLFSI